MEKRSSDGKFWDDSIELTVEEKWKCASLKFYILLLNDLKSSPIWVSFMSGSYSAGKDLLNALRTAIQEKKDKIFWRSYQLGSETGKKKKLKKTIRPLGYIQNESIVDFAEKVYNEIKGRDFVVEESTSEIEMD